MTVMSAELCRDIAVEAARRGARVNIHELWTLLEAVDDVGARIVVDVGSGEPVWWSWWSLGARVIAVKPWPPGDRLDTVWPSGPPSSVAEFDGDPAGPATVARVRDCLAGALADVVVLASAGDEHGARADWNAYAPLCRPGGLVVVHCIAHPKMPGVGRFWAGLDRTGAKELVSSNNPMGYGVLTINVDGTGRHG